MNTTITDRDALAASITRQSSKQSYYIFRILADRDYLNHAYRAYAYFRWVDDLLDESEGTREGKLAFAERQRGLLDDLYGGVIPLDLTPEEELLVDLVQSDPDPQSGLYLYLDNMMKVMEFDVQRRDRVISTAELADYTHWLAVAVTELLHYVIGHDQPEPHTDDRYLAVAAAHITHMLRDTVDDNQNGYYNIPAAYLEKAQITPLDIESEAYRGWVCSRVQLAREYFQAGRKNLSLGKNFRRRLAGFAYTTRFEWMLRTIERENYCLRSEYPDRKRLPATFWIIWNTLRSISKIPLGKRTYIPLSPPGAEVSKT